MRHRCIGSIPRRGLSTRRVVNTSALGEGTTGRNLMLLGAPGAGKGTYSKYIAQTFNLPIIGTGDMIRAVIKAGGEHGKRLQQYSDLGQLVPDEDVLELLRTRLLESDAQNGFILDGFPRTVPQALALRTFAPLHLVLNIVLPDKHVVAKLLGRRGCSSCGRGYNVADVHDDVAEVYMPAMLPPTVNNSDDTEVLVCECGCTLSSRSDDIPDVISARLELYHRETAPLIDHYRAEGVLADYHVRSVVGDMPELERELQQVLTC